MTGFVAAAPAGHVFPPGTPENLRRLVLRPCVDTARATARRTMLPRRHAAAQAAPRCGKIGGKVRTRRYDRTKPTTSLTAFIVSPASFCARREPSANTASMAAGSSSSRFISAAIGAELGNGQIGQCRLEGRELRIAEFLEHAGARGVGQRRVDADEIVGLGAGREPFFLAGQRFRIGFGAADLLCDRVGIVGEIDAGIIRSIGLRHLFRAVAQRHDPCRFAGDQRLGQGKECVAETFVPWIESAEIIVELLRDVARELKVLLLILADRHMRGAIDENVGRHQRRIGVEADRRILAVLARLLLELRHPIEPAQPRHAVEYPGEFGVLRHLALIEHDVFFRVDAAGEERRGDLTDGTRKLGRVLPGCDRMQIDDAIDAVVAVLQFGKALDGAEVIAKMQVAGRLDAGKNQFLERHAGSPRSSATCHVGALPRKSRPL